VFLSGDVFWLNTGRAKVMTSNAAVRTGNIGLLPYLTPQMQAAGLLFAQVHKPKFTAQRGLGNSVPFLPSK
jgi:hypothetical protein